MALPPPPGSGAPSSIDARFGNDLHRFVSTCQLLAAAVDAREVTLGHVAKAIAAALPQPRSAEQFFLLRSITVEFATKAVEALAPEHAQALWPLVRLPPLTEDLGEVLVQCLSFVYRQPPRPRAAQTIRGLRADRAMALIFKRCCEPNLTLDTVARAVGVSSSYLRKLLHVQHGCGFPAALHGARVSAACRLLESSMKSVKEVAVDVGYASTSDLDRHFKSQYGLTPGEYRLARARLQYERKSPKPSTATPRDPKTRPDAMAVVDSAK